MMVSGVLYFLSVSCEAARAAQCVRNSQIKMCSEGERKTPTRGVPRDHNERAKCLTGVQVRVAGTVRDVSRRSKKSEVTPEGHVRVLLRDTTKQVNRSITGRFRMFHLFDPSNFGC